MCCLALAGCNSLDTPTDAGATCAITITGAAAIAGSYTCTSSPITLYVPTTNTGALNVSVSGSKSIAGLFAFFGEPTAGTTYSSANSAGLQSYGVLVTVGTASWEFSAGAQAAPLGSGTLTFTTVGAASIGSTGTLYNAHGTLDATLVPSPGTTASGNAMLHVEF